MILTDPLKKNTVQLGLLLELGNGYDYINGDGINPRQEKDSSPRGRTQAHRSTSALLIPMQTTQARTPSATTTYAQTTATRSR
jgi:hypothetical protein